MAEDNRQITDEKIFTGALDLDSDERFIKPEDYRSLVNAIKSGDGENKVVVNMKGTNTKHLTVIDGIDNAAGYSIVGSVYDYKNKGLILLMDIQGNKHIVRVKEDESAEDILIGNSYVNFDSHSNVKIIDDLLVWQEKDKAAQVINLNKAEAGTVTYDSGVDLSLVKKPPLYTITTTYGYDPGFHGSNVFRKMFQFRQQYIYNDSLKSCFGNTSDIAFNSDVFSVEDNVIQKEDTQNFIDILFNSGDETVEKIRIAAREGNTREWFEIAIIEKNNPGYVHNETAGNSSVTYETSLLNDTDYYFRFFNTGGYRFIPKEEIEKPFEFLPVSSGCMTSLGNNRLAFGQNQHDYSDVDLGSLTITPSYNTLPSSAGVYPSLKRGRYYQVVMRVMDSFQRGTQPLSRETTNFYVQDSYDTLNKGVVKLNCTNIDTITFPDWAEYYQFAITAPYIPFIQLPILYADEYRDLNGETDGTIALLVGFSADAINDIIEDKVEDLKNQLSNVKEIINVYDNTTFQRKLTNKRREELINQNVQDAIREKDVSDDIAELSYGELKDKKQELEKEIDSQKQELGNSYKKALANLRQYEINRNDRVRILEKDFTESGSAIYSNQVLDLQILDVFNENTYWNKTEGTWETQSGMWIKVDSPQLDGFTIEDIREMHEFRWLQADDSIMGTGRAAHGNVVDSNDNIYILGGYNTESGYFNDVWRSTDGGVTWSFRTLSAWNTSRYGHSCVIDGSDKLYVLGGKDSSGFLNEIWYSNDGGSTWSEQTASGHWEARNQFGAVITSSGRIYVFGGCTGFGSNYTVKNDVWYSDDGGASWSEVTSYGTGEIWSARRSFAYCIDNNDRIFVMGGEDASNNYLKDVWYTDDPTDKWIQATSEAIWGERTEFSAIVDSYNRIYIIGGLKKVERIRTQYRTMNDVYVSGDGEGLYWNVLAAASEFKKRSLYGLVIDSNNNIYVTAGNSDDPNHFFYELDDVYYKLGAVSSQWQDAMIEIYKPHYSDSSNIFHEISGVYPVSDTSNKTLEPSNCFLKKQALYSSGTLHQKGKKKEVWVEDTHLTHDFKSDNYDLGRVFIRTDIERGTTLPSIVLTNQHIEGTQINGLSQADYNNVIYLSSENGKIYSLQNQGRVIKAIQEHKITAVQENKERSTLSEDYGSVHPKSVIKSPLTGYIYGFDLYKSKPWRDVGDRVHGLAGKVFVGSDLIEYKVESYFKSISEELRQTGSTAGSNDVVCGYDEENSLLFMSFPSSLTSVDYTTIIFDEKQNQWIGFFDTNYGPQDFAGGPNIFVSTDDGTGYLNFHNSDNVDRNFLYNYNSTETSIEIVANKASNLVKIFNAVRLHASDKFEINPVIVPSTDTTTGREMKSRLTKENLEEIDGVYKASFFKNMKTTDDTERTNELLVGESLRGYTLKLKLINTSSDKVELFKCDILSEINF